MLVGTGWLPGASKLGMTVCGTLLSFSEGTVEAGAVSPLSRAGDESTSVAGVESFTVVGVGLSGAAAGAWDGVVGVVTASSAPGSVGRVDGDADAI